MAIPITAREPVEFTPPSSPAHLLEEDPATGQPKFAIKIRVPTVVERDSYASALVRAGVVIYTRNQIREITLAGVQTIFPPEQHDEITTMLEELWQVSDAESRRDDAQREKLMELLEKAKAKGGKDATPDPTDVKLELEKIKPDVVMERMRRIKASAASQQIMAEFEPLREAIAGIADQDAKRSWLNAEVYIVGWRGLEHEPDGNGRGGITRAEAEYLRGKIGQEAFLETSDFITALTGLDGDEEKNLASLLESSSAQLGSTQPTTAAGSDPGSSTDEPSGQTQDGTASQKTTGSSSGSSTTSGTKKKATKGNGRTAGRSSTSR